ncbi:beta and beta-prime subunits of DNA dependent RNA-polymerase [Aulographum hederae CBS 113979]|uniref:DNA-directed RNA polymerase subunit n=1 Tax=Aulographum hederae CBS 113979 TaxID=1176131 RepID=A0A6G1GXH5_9PEZI|nr:beta and beta-prime subunits of DNA dependent RNA-polymerase [Aulographum hederae CBS 113979]
MVQLNGTFAMSSAPLKTIREIQFGLMSPEEIKNMSVCHILYPETMDEGKQRPREKGLADPKLGSIDRAYACGSCGEDMTNCPGHFGHIELAVPVFHVGFITKIKKLLETVCHACGKVLVDEGNPAYVDALRIRDPKKRFDAVHKLCKPKRSCEQDPVAKDDEPGEPLKKPSKPGHGGCGNLQPEIRKEGLKLMGTYKIPKDQDEEDGRQPDKRPVTPQMALEIFKRISDYDLQCIGLSTNWARPEWMIISMLPVPPPPVRPSVAMDGNAGVRGEDDLTYKLGDIIRANANVRRCQSTGSPQHVVQEFETLLQYHVATYMDNNIAGQPQALQKSGRPLKTIRSRLKGKEGRLRGNLMGKRVDFSARTVITGDPNLSLDEVGVPRSIARILTYPEIVNPYNIAKLTQLVRNGPNVHPGAKYVIRDGNQRIDLRHAKGGSEITLAYGQKVERHIVDGDFIIFNRQPSLHKESMMGHRVRVMPYSTFRLNLSVTSPYNADFDGDEMNLHVPQTSETRAEIMQLCMVPLNIVSPQGNKPLMGIVQDTLCGIYKMCRRDVFLNKEMVMNILMWVPDWDGVIPQPAILKPYPCWTGKQIVSLIIPDGLNLLQRDDEGSHTLRDEGLLVQDGQLMYGLFKKKSVGAAAGGIIHIVYNEKGWEAAVNFFNGAQRVVNYWLLHNGFSIGIGDTIPDAKTTADIQNAVTEQKNEVEEIIKTANNDMLEPLPGMNIRETFESKVSKALNTARDVAGKRTEDNLKDLNNAIQMSRSGSKGSAINISQMTAVVGQQSVEGKRIPFGFKYRSLPHFTKDDYSAESRGFVENSYLRGLTPSEFFFHAMAGREGLIDTAVKTAETGYIQRRLVKALEDVMAKYDGTVRNSLGDIVQFVYGEDGLDAVHIEEQTMSHGTCSHDRFEKTYRVDVTNPKFMISSEYLEQASEIKGDVEVQKYFDEEYTQLEEDREFLRDHRQDDDSVKYYLPLNIARIITTAKTKFQIRDGARSDLHPEDAIPKVKEMLDRLMIVRGDDPLSQEAQYQATILIKALIRSQLAFKVLVTTHNLNKLAFENVIGDIENRFARAVVSPGEMVGVLAAQSIGEPATQMTLNTFHFAGVSSKNVTLGVPRLKEILNVATTLKTPAMKVYQDPRNGRTQEGAKALRNLVEHTTLRSVAETTEVYYDPDVQTTVIEADTDMVESFFLIPEDVLDDPSLQSKWLLRIILSRRKLLDKALTVADVAAKIKEEYKNDVAIIFSDNNADQQVIRIRTKNNDKEETGDDVNADEVLKQIQAHLLDDLTLRGVRGVSRAFITSEATVRVEPDGSVKKSTNNDPEHCEWYLDTSGIALAQVLQVDGVDASRTYTNSFDEVLKVFGIEAARSCLMKELHAVLSFDGSYVNHRHLALLCDIMTARGYLMAVTRHGINRAETGALMRCSFEETVEILLEAAAAGELDDCKGISENVMLGQLAPMGTGEMEILVDQNMLMTSTTDNSRMGAAGGGNMNDMGAATPYDLGSPSYEGPTGGVSYGDFSPMQVPGAHGVPGFASAYGGGYGDGGVSPYAGGTSPAYAPTSPFSMGTSPTSPGYSPASPAFTPTSPGMNLTSPRYGGTSPGFSPVSPAFEPTTPSYAPTSPAYQPTGSPSSPAYSPASPMFSPTSPGAAHGPVSPSFSPTSPQYSPTSPRQAASPEYTPTSPAYSPASPMWSPTSPNMQSDKRSPNSPTSPAYSPTSPQFSPTSPQFSPTSPAQDAYSPTSPQFSPQSPTGQPRGGQSPTSPQYSPTSPQYSPTSPHSK